MVHSNQLQKFKTINAKLRIEMAELKEKETQKQLDAAQVRDQLSKIQLREQIKQRKQTELRLEQLKKDSETEIMKASGLIIDETVIYVNPAACIVFDTNAMYHVPTRNILIRHIQLQFS